MWLGDQDAKKLIPRAELLAQRADLEKKIKDINAQPMPKEEWQKRFRNEDLTKLAKQILNIDKKLGRK